VELGNEKKHGVKCRFGHPTMSADAIGSFAGRFKSFWLDGNVARADLHLADVAEIAPAGNLKEYIKEMAQDEPDMFGASIVFTPSREFQVIDDDETIIIDPNNFDPNEPVFVGIKSLHQIDVVDDPAANASFFSQSTNKMKAHIVSDFLDENPDIYRLILDNPDVINSFMIKYNQYHKNKEMVVMEKEKETKKEELIPEVKPVTTVDNREIFKAMYDEFGAEFAAQMFAAGISIEDARIEYIKLQEIQVQELKKELLASQGNLAAITESVGVDPVEVDPVDEIKDTSEYDSKIEKYSPIIGENMAKFAANLKFA